MTESIFNTPLCSGNGQYHSNKPDAKVRKPYTTISLAEISTMVENPQQVHKDYSRWVIPSSLLSRNFAEQESNGNYCALWFDLDDNPPDLKSLEAIVRVIQGDCCHMLYTTSSATKENPKSRGILPIQPISGSNWKICQEVLTDKLTNNGIAFDDISHRTGQLCFLPNKGMYYDYRLNVDSELLNPLVHFQAEIEQKKAEIQQKELETQQRLELAKQRRKQRKFAPDTSIIDKFNQSFTVEEILLKAGYKQRGSKFCHPFSSSGSYAVSVKDGRVHSLSSSDPLYTGGHGVGAHSAYSAFAALKEAGLLS